MNCSLPRDLNCMSPAREKVSLRQNGSMQPPLPAVMATAWIPRDWSASDSGLTQYEME